MKRGSVLAEAINTINGERQDTYGNPEDSFEVIATYWNTYLGRRISLSGPLLSAKDIAIMMVLFKVAREQNQGKRDNLVDAAGYLGIAGDMDVKPEPKKANCPPLDITREDYLQGITDSLMDYTVVPQPQDLGSIIGSRKLGGLQP